jgi:iron complex outermembrane receptor protein
MLYVVSRCSYRNGGFNATLPPKDGYSDVTGDQYRPERLTDVELGLKYQGRLGEMPTRLNLDVYHNWVDDSQRTAFANIAGAPTAVTVNVPVSRASGVEFDGEIRPFSWLSAGATLSYIDTDITDGNTFVAGSPMLFATTPDAPRWTQSVFAKADIPLTLKYTLTLRGDGYHQTATWITSTCNLNPGAELPGYTVADFTLGLTNVDGWSVTGRVKNAFDRTYYVGGIALAQLVGFNSALPGAPRTFMLEARYQFGQ